MNFNNNLRGEEMKTKKIYITLFVVFMIACCTGCNQKEENKKMSELEKKLSKDIHIEDRTDMYFHEQTITVSSNNGYKCIDSDVDFNEEEKQYTITIKFGIPIDKD